MISEMDVIPTRVDTFDVRFNQRICAGTVVITRPGRPEQGDQKFDVIAAKLKNARDRPPP
jgi:hypothetical protein